MTTRSSPARRWLVAAAVLVPAVAATPGRAEAPAFTCPGVQDVGNWQRIPIPAFEPIPNVPSMDQVSAYSVSATSPELVVATNGKRLQVSTVAGCAWSNGLVLGLEPTTAVPLSGASSTIVATAVLPTGRVLAAVREGTGSASRPHIVASEDGTAGFRTYNTGLPAQGVPRLLVAASDGRTLYLVLTPSAPASEPAPGVPTLPGPPDVTAPTGSKVGLLYASSDGGRSWLLATGPDDLPAGGGGLDRLAVDHRNPHHLYAVSGGLLLNSTNGGRSFQRSRMPDGDVTAVEAMGSAAVAVFTAGGVVALSRDGGHTFSRARTVAGVSSAAYREGDGRLAVEVKGTLSLVDPKTGLAERVPNLRAEPGSLLGDVGPQATFHGLSAHHLLRYADQAPATTPDVIGTDSDFGAPPPTPGTITPGFRSVRLPVGTSALFGYTLEMKVSRTPLDVMLLLDTAPSMSPYLDDVRASVPNLVETIKEAGIDLQVGVAAFGTGPRPGPLAVAPPYVNPENPTDFGSSLYRRHRRVSPVDAGLPAALSRVTSEREHGDRAQLMALEQAALGSGVKPPLVPDAVPLYLVPPDRGAAWRPDPGVRRLLVVGTDQPFGNPGGSRHKPDGSLDIERVAFELRDWVRVQVLAHTYGSRAAQSDLTRVAVGTRTFASPAGADCGNSRLPPGAPLVCGTTADIGGVSGRIIVGLPDRQTVTLEPLGADPHVVSSVESRALQNLDVTRPNLVPFSLRVSCVNRGPGRWNEQVVAKIRGLSLATTRLAVDCVGRGAVPAVPAPAPVARAVAPAAQPPPAAAAPAAVPPVVPVAQPQVAPQAQPQLQPQHQVNPLTAAALQRQEEVELARALADGSEHTTLAMVGQREREESAALLLLASAMSASAALGLARLRMRAQHEGARAPVNREADR